MLRFNVRVKKVSLTCESKIKKLKKGKTKQRNDELIKRGNGHKIREIISK